MKISNLVSRNLTSFMTEHNIIEKEQEEIYAYCFDFILDILLFNVSILLIGFILNMPGLAFIYIVTMTPTKMMAGGAHAKSQGMCSIISYFMVIISFLLAINLSSLIADTRIMVPLFYAFAISIAVFAPVDTPNKRLDTTKCKKLKKSCSFYLLALGLLVLIFYRFNLTKYYSIMTICVIIVAINQYIGIYINKNNKETTE